MSKHTLSGRLADRFLSGCSAVVSRIFPLDDLPTPSGPHGVGTDIFEWVDHTRPEHFVAETQKVRRLSGQVWYPAVTTPDPERWRYLDHPQRRLEMIAYQTGLPKFLVAHMAEVRTNAVFAAPWAMPADPLPLVLFSHGLSGMKNQNSIQAELLASYGFVVVSVDHAYDAFLTLFSDGSEADYRAADTQNRTGDAFWAFRLPQLKTRVADLRFVLDEIERRGALGESQWAKVDTRSVGVFGHSFGGASALLAAHEDARVGRSLALDGWMLPVPTEVVRAGTQKPFYYLGQAAWEDPLNYKKLDRYLAGSPQGQKQLVEGTKHFDYSDAPQFTDLAKRFGLSGSMSRLELREMINETVLSFFTDR